MPTPRHRTCGPERPRDPVTNFLALSPRATGKRSGSAPLSLMQDPTRCSHRHFRLFGSPIEETPPGGRLCPLRLFEAGRFLLPQGWQLPMCRARFAWCDADKSCSHFAGHDRGVSASFRRRRSASSRHLFFPRCWGSCANNTTMPQQSGHKSAVLRLSNLIGSYSAGRSNGSTGQAPSASRSSFGARAIIAARTSS